MKLKDIPMDTSKQASISEKKAHEVYLNSIITTAKENFLKDGELTPIVFIGTSIANEINMTVIPVAEFMASISSKDLLSKMLHQIGKEIEPVCICMITEAWMAIANADSKDDIVQRGVKNTPGRKEILLFTFESENIIETRTCEIIREDKISLDEDLVTIPDRSEGRFTGLLKDIKKIKLN